MADGIQFNDEQDAGFEPVHRDTEMQSDENAGKPLVALVKKMHLAQNDTQAQYILLSVGIVLILISLYILGHNILGIGKGGQKVIYDIPADQIAKFPPNIQKQILAAKKK